MTNSLIQKNNSCCYICGYKGKLHCHHVFYGTANRKKSDADGMVVFLCPVHHNMSNVGIHNNKQLDEYVKKQAEKIWIQNYSDKEKAEDKIQDFIDRYGINYLDEEELG